MDLSYFSLNSAFVCLSQVQDRVVEKSSLVVCACVDAIYRKLLQFRVCSDQLSANDDLNWDAIKEKLTNMFLPDPVRIASQEMRSLMSDEISPQRSSTVCENGILSNRHKKHFSQCYWGQTWLSR
ncbi:hypothetical protein Ciccas_003447 [Cichlidogyrus casuarinus]|uniref:Uncharacterized protein n=1 Tax=Cichlidogyrus casuarinus TaxID=1844966 RepID=A0ABD2QEC7_9PLAT